MKTDHYKIAVEMPMEIYKRIKKRAAKNKRSFSAEANDLLACGLLDLLQQEETEEFDGHSAPSTLEQLQAMMAKSYT